MATTCLLYDRGLKEDVGSLRRGGGSGCGGKACFLCRRDLGRIINRGACCPHCRERVCKSCRQYCTSSAWLCTLCYRELNAGEWMNDILEANKVKDVNATENIKRTIQRSWTFSETSGSPWSYLRGSPEMRAYSSLPRDSDSIPAFIQHKTPPPTLEPSPQLDKKLPSPSPVFRKVHLRIDARNLPPGVTPPRSRRRQESWEEMAAECEDYRLVFLSSSDSSEPEDPDWDYFECWSAEVEGGERAEGGRAERAEGGASARPVLLPVPFPVPVPVLVPVPYRPMSVPPAAPRDEARVVLKVYRSLDPAEEILRLTEERLKDFTDLRQDSGSSEDEDAPASRVYRLRADDSEDSPDSSDDEGGGFARVLVIQDLPSSPEPEEAPDGDVIEDPSSSPEPAEAVNGDVITEFSVSEPTELCTDVTQDLLSTNDNNKLSISCHQPAEPLKHDVIQDPPSSPKQAEPPKDDVMQGIFSSPRSAEPPRPTIIQVPFFGPDPTEHPNDDVVQGVSSSPESAADDESPTESERNDDQWPGDTNLSDNSVEQTELSSDKSELTTHLSPGSEQLSESRVDKIVEIAGTENSTCDVIDSIITFSHEEILQIMTEFLSAERRFDRPPPVDVADTGAELERATCEEEGAETKVEETQSNTSDEFSGTESTELACGTVQLQTGEEMGPSGCLEEGLADDDSWVEDLDMATDSSEEDREEGLRGYHRAAIDFTLHTIAEESCEESEVEAARPTELERYFFYGLGQCVEADTASETSSVYSEGLESAGDGDQQQADSAEPAASRLEKYFLSGFMGFSRRDSDGSVGSDSEGRPSPEQRRKRLVRARGTGRQHSSSLDNLADCEQQSEQQLETEGSSTETDSHDEQGISFDKIDGQFDTVKRTKKKKRSVPSAPAELLEAPENSGSKEDVSEEGKKTPQPADSLPSDVLNSRNKQQSRDSGFVGSCDDLLKEPHSSSAETQKTEDIKNKDIPKREGCLQMAGSAPGLSRKDSFNNWSSDEETNLMMSKMRAFFKTMVGNQPKGASPNLKPKSKPPQLVYFENELTRLMKTVPGIRDEQVKEIVEYLSSEDTWSDSYDSSDYTSSDLETGNKRSALQEEISASCRQIISNFENSTIEDSYLDTPQSNNNDLVQRWVQRWGSFNKMDVPKPESTQNSPPLIEKVMQHIGSRLWALMHEVSGGEGSPRRHRRLASKLSVTSTTEEEEEEEEEREVEEFRALPRSKSHDPLLEEGRQEASDNERFSWRGSFESALLASSDSRTRLASAGELAAKRRSAGDLMLRSSREQLDRVRSCGSIGGSAEKIWTARRLSESEEEEAPRHTLPRALQTGAANTTSSLPRLPTYKAHSVKSARYRPPGYRGSPVAPPPPRRDRRRNLSAASLTLQGCDDSSVCSEPISKAEDEVDRLINHRASLGARSDSLASVYSGAGEGRHGGLAVRGEVQFGLQYNYKQSSLEIHVKQCRDLAPVDTKRNRSDPYVKVYLLPDKSKAGKRKTRVKKHTLNPIFDEVLRFQVKLDSLENHTLWLSVWHSDMFGRNDFLGEVLMPLENKVFDDPLPKFYTLQERSEALEELNSKGELIVGLKYEPPDENSKKKSKGSLSVLIKEAKNLPAVKSNMSSDPFCKSYLLPDKGRWSKQKAPVIRKTCNPVWNHTFSYQNVSLQELQERSLELTIWDHDRLASNEFLGGVRLNLGTGKHHGKVVDWMDSSGNEITLWERMLERPNFWVESCLPLRPSLDVRNNV